jgi:hypothetical protein
MFEHVGHGEVLEDATPSGIRILEIADHLLVYVQILL